MVINSISSQTKTHRNGIIHLGHEVFIETAHMLTQAFFIYGTNLLQKHHGILGQSHIHAGQSNVRWQFCLSRLTGNGRGYDRGRMPISGIVLDDKYRSCAPLLATDYRAEIRIKDIAAPYA